MARYSEASGNSEWRVGGTRGNSGGGTRELGHPYFGNSDTHILADGNSDTHIFSAPRNSDTHILASADGTRTPIFRGELGHPYFSKRELGELAENSSVRELGRAGTRGGNSRELGIYGELVWRTRWRTRRTRTPIFWRGTREGNSDTHISRRELGHPY